MGVRGPGPIHPKRALGTVESPGFPDPVSPTVAPYSPSVRPMPSQLRSAYTVAAGARYTPPLTKRDQTTRAILLAKATVTNIFGLRVSICASHDPAGAPRKQAWRITALAPRMSKRRMVRSPSFDTAPSFCLPPVDLCSGVSPSQAAKSRPVREVLRRWHECDDRGRGDRPTPGIVIIRRAIWLDFARSSGERRRG
jgi:hypothetical protein